MDFIMECMIGGTVGLVACCSFIGGVVALSRATDKVWEYFSISKKKRKMEKKLIEDIAILIKKWKNGNEEPLDIYEVKYLAYMIKAKINHHEGNITEYEYYKFLDVPREKI